MAKMMNIAGLVYSRWVSFGCMLFCFGILGVAAYLQIYLKLMPCPLCVLQRIIFLLLGFVFLVSALYTSHARYGKRLHSGIILFLSIIGIIFSSRHVWLTLQPPSDLTSCSPTLEYMLQNLPLTETLKVLFLGSGDCAKVSYRLLGLNIPEWTLIIFIGLALFGWVRYIVAKDRRDLP